MREKVVFYAQEEAQRFGEGLVSTEHLLLGLVRESDNVAARVLGQMGVSLDRVRTEVEKQLPRGDKRPSQDMTLTPRAKRVIDLAYDEARSLDNDYMGTEHLLLGLIREGDGLAGRVLDKLGVRLELARAIVVDIQSKEGEEKGSADPAKVAPTSMQNRLAALLEKLVKRGVLDEGKAVPKREIVAIAAQTNLAPAFDFLRAVGVLPTYCNGALNLRAADESKTREILERAFETNHVVLFFFTAPTLETLDLCFGAQIALTMHPERTLIVRTGQTAPLADHLEEKVIVLNNSEDSRLAVIAALWRAGCFGESWKTEGDFED